MGRKRETKAQREKRLEAEAQAALEREELVEKVLELLLAGADRATLTRTARSQEWEVDAEQLEAIVADARAMMQEAAGGDRGTLLAEHIAKVRRLYRRAVSQGDTRTAAALLREERELLGLTETERQPARPAPDWHTPAPDVQGST